MRRRSATRVRARPNGLADRLTRGQKPYVGALVVVLVVLAAMLSGPLERWTAAADRVDELRSERDGLVETVEDLEERLERLDDPEQVEIEARELGLVKPGEIPYVVVPPERAETDEVVPTEPDEDEEWWRRAARRLRELVGQ